ncbi:hypothetical protein [Enterocloster clostridioformis]|uniref:hypothetical protein n=1 Tax=Enterocloster clostridioformis TaxID=1531 RepID=UPI0004151676|nr:hypothetical protein [Enterocloster clostridioformis]
MKNVNTSYGTVPECVFSHALYAEECRDVTLKNFRGQAARSSLENVVIRQDES